MFRVRLTIVVASLLFGNFVQADVIDGEDLIDPTRPLVPAYNGELGQPIVIRNFVPGSYSLTFIRASISNPMAVINNQRVTIGDVIDGATVSKISRSTVTLTSEENEQVIGLYDTSVKRAVLNP